MKKIAKNLNFKEILYFGIAGVIGYLVDVIVTLVLNPILGEYFARIPGFLAAATATWVFNRLFTFGKESSKHTNIFKEYLHYLSLMVFGLAVNYVTYVIAVSILIDNKWAIPISIAFGSLAGMTVNYLNAKKYIFNK